MMRLPSGLRLAGNMIAVHLAGTRARRPPGVLDLSLRWCVHRSANAVNPGISLRSTWCIVVHTSRCRRLTSLAFADDTARWKEQRPGASEHAAIATIS